LVATGDIEKHLFCTLTFNLKCYSFHYTAVPSAGQYFKGINRYFYSTCTMFIAPLHLHRLEPFLLNVRNILSSNVSSLSEHQDLILCPGLTEFVQTCCGAPLVMLGYVCKHVYIYVSWNYSCCQRQLNLLLICGKN